MSFGNPFKDFGKKKIDSSKKIENKERGLSEIISINDNADHLVKYLHLENLKAVLPSRKDEEYIWGSDRETNIISRNLTFNSEISLESLKENIKTINTEEYKKYPLIDLGSNGNPELSVFAQEIGVPGVVAVDIAEQIPKEALEEVKKKPEYKNKKFPVLGLSIDMLELLQQLPENSCNVSMFSIDQAIMPSDSYLQKVEEQLYRIIPEDGLLIVENSLVETIHSRRRKEWKNLEEDHSTLTRSILSERGNFFQKIPQNNNLEVHL